MKLDIFVKRNVQVPMKTENLNTQEVTSRFFYNNNNNNIVEKPVESYVKAEKLFT